MAERLRALHIDYLDEAGNCHIDAGQRFFISVEGRREPLESIKRAPSRSAGQQLLFVLAAKPEALDLPIRELAQLAGAGKSAAAEMLSRLTEEGILGATRSGRKILRPGLILERWVSAYPDVRRRWLQGRYRAQDSRVEELEERMLEALPADGWAWGGTAAAMRLVRHYRGPETVVYLRESAPDLPKRLRIVPDREGPISVLVTPPPLAYESRVAHVAHPLLVYSELLSSGDERAMDAATKIRDRFLE